MKLFTLEGEVSLTTTSFDTGVQSAKEKIKGLKTDMEGVQEEAKNTGGILDTALGHALGDFISSMAGTLTDVVFTIASDGVMLASSMQEVKNVVDTTFGADAAAIEAWALTTRRAFGMGELSAKTYAGTMGATLKGLGVGEDQLFDMSTALVGLAGDMASFRNIEIGTAFQKIMSGITGETEPLKQLGIVMTETNLKAHALAMGIETDFSKLDSATQTQVRYSYLMQQTADMQGDFAKTSESYSNQLRLMQENIESLKISVGESLLPVMTDLVGWFNSLFGGQKDASDGVNALKDSYDNSIVSIENTTTQALALVTALEQLSASGEDAASSEMWSAIMTELGNTIPGIGDLIDANTGKINGGTDALRAYVEQWRVTNRELAQMQVLQGMQQEQDRLTAELAKLQTGQKIAEIRAGGAQQAMADLGGQLLSYMIDGMTKGGASSADIQAMQRFGSSGAAGLLALMAHGGAANAVMGGSFEGGDLWKNKSFMEYFLAGGGSAALLEQMVALYKGEETTYKKYKEQDYEQGIADTQEALAAATEEYAIAQQLLAEANAKADEANKAAAASGTAGEGGGGGAAPKANVEAKFDVKVSVDGNEIASVVTPKVMAAIEQEILSRRYD